MHLVNALIVVDNADPEWYHKFIVNIFDMVLEGAPMLPPHALFQLEPNIFLEVATLIPSQMHISQFL